MRTRVFNTAGPCRAEFDYMLSATSRLPEVLTLIEQQKYFVLHAPRQIGKTTAIGSLARDLLAEGRYTSALVSVEVGAAFRHDPAACERAILADWRKSLRLKLPADCQPPPFPDAPSGSGIGVALNAWAEACYRAGRPLVLFLDEIDSLEDESLISILRQLRDGYSDRPHGFPWSLALVGMRDVRDYKVRAGGSERLHTASPFNIKVASLTLRNFNAPEVAELLHQHTEDTGQVFSPEATARIFDLSQGHPWLVNALARELVEKLVPDRTQAISEAQVLQAKENLILRMDTHLDSLAERLREDRVRHIIEPMLAGTLFDGSVTSDDQRFVLDLGLCRLGPGGSLVIANPIYQEVIPRMLGENAQRSIRPNLKPTWLDAEGKLAPDRLLDAFLSFWRENGEALLQSVPYHEVAPQLVLMAFLHRVVNGGGSIQREYAIGTRRMDLCLRHGDLTLGIELKVWRPKQPDPLDEGLVQLDEYLDTLNQPTGWLVLFDRRPKRLPLSKRLTVTQTKSPTTRNITVIRA